MDPIHKAKAAKVEKIPGRELSLPAFTLGLDSSGIYLTLLARQQINPNDCMSLGATLLQQNLVQVETEYTDEKFVKGVVVYDEQGRKRDMAMTDIHRGVMSLLCGEESIPLLESHRRIGTMAWMMTGGGKDMNSNPVLHSMYPLSSASTTSSTSKNRKSSNKKGKK